MFSQAFGSELRISGCSLAALCSLEKEFTLTLVKGEYITLVEFLDHTAPAEMVCLLLSFQERRKNSA